MALIWLLTPWAGRVIMNIGSICGIVFAASSRTTIFGRVKVSPFQSLCSSRAEAGSVVPAIAAKVGNLPTAENEYTIEAIPREGVKRKLCFSIC